MSGILGITFLKSEEMADEMHAAMYCRGFTGDYPMSPKESLHIADLFYIVILPVSYTHLDVYKRQALGVISDMVDIELAIHIANELGYEWNQEMMF